MGHVGAASSRGGGGLPHMEGGWAATRGGAATLRKDIIMGTYVVLTEFSIKFPVIYKQETAIFKYINTRRLRIM